MFKFFSIFLLLILLQVNIGTASAYDNNNHYFTVKSGDSLGKYFVKLGLSKRLLINLLSANKENKRLNKIKIGEKIIIRLHNNNRFQSLSYQSHNKTTLNIILNGVHFANTITGIRVKKNTKPLSVKIVTINNSFGYDAQRAGLGLNTINMVVKALSWQLDFNSALHKGDRFYIVSDGSNFPAGIIYQGNNKRIEAFSHYDKNGQIQYYDRQGYGLNSGFLKYPLKFKHISSKFQLKRYHPILKTYRPHRAVDYAAAHGTPVRATADGVVKSSGWNGALGKAIILNHGVKYTTVYAHLSKYARGLRKGKTVKKGQIIGYVGSTGRSTGAHLHYELRYQGKRKNPHTYKLPKQLKVNKDELSQFRSNVENILASL
jgi:murein DD-endopeptidase MepM/ murein hydrolase activator NlpD